MPRASLFYRLPFVAPAATLVVTLTAQSVTPVESEQTITLLPFSVTAEKSSGYRVTTATRTSPPRTYHFTLTASFQTRDAAVQA